MVIAIDHHLDMSAVPSSSPSWIADLTALRRAGSQDGFLADGSPAPHGRLFGGLVAAQALAAACRTVEPSKHPQSFHLYFVRPGQPNVAVTYDVERTRDGRSFDTRRITARQADTVILEMLASFHRPEPGADQHPPAPPMVELADTAEVSGMPGLDGKFEIRVPRARPEFQGPPYWIRSREPVEPDVVSQACALAYMSDIALMAAARPPGTPLAFEGVSAASLDHAVWLHRPFHPERWHRYQAASVNNSDARGLAFGGFYDERGTLVANLAQEALWRLPA